MKKTNLSTYFIFISIFTFFSVLVAIIQKSYSNLVGPVNQIQTASYEKAISPELDLSVIEDIEKRPLNLNENNSGLVNFSSQSASTGTVSSELSL